MTVTLRRQIDDTEKTEILARYGRKCFATGHLIPDGEVVQFDHIKAFASHGASELNNIAPMCETHNKQKGTLSLEDFRVKLRLGEFFAQGDALTLKHLLNHMKSKGDIQTFGQSVIVTANDSNVELESATGEKRQYALYQCPITGWKYFYATLPIDLLNSDDEEDDKIGLQPRYLILEKVFELYRHFQRHPVLQPSIGRVHQGRIFLFDGQHKAAALLWTGRREFECKIYLDPDLRLLNNTNISAHDKFAQTRFYSSIMIMKLGSEFGADFEQYKNLEEEAAKSEAGFIKYLERDPSRPMTRGERSERFRNYLYNSILEDPQNKASQLVSKANRSTDQTPLTMDMIIKSLFTHFLYREPVEDDMATESYKRDKEIENNVYLMNVLYDLALNAWNPSAGPNDATQKRLARLFRSKSIMAWSELLKSAICGTLNLDDADDRARPFYRDLSQVNLDAIRRVVVRLMDWPLWNAPTTDDIDRVLNDNREQVKTWFKSKGLTTGYLMGAPD